MSDIGKSLFREKTLQNRHRIFCFFKLKKCILFHRIWQFIKINLFSHVDFTKHFYPWVKNRIKKKHPTKPLAYWPMPFLFSSSLLPVFLPSFPLSSLPGFLSPFLLFFFAPFLTCFLPPSPTDGNNCFCTHPALLLRLVQGGHRYDSGLKTKFPRAFSHHFM